MLRLLYRLVENGTIKGYVHENTETGELECRDCNMKRIDNDESKDSN